uniref:Uncharacterized protein n=1 Tax=Romanomermis culicivorax TaxID=13658 RepID=A0A915J6N7_ROMCU
MLLIRYSEIICQSAYGKIDDGKTGKITDKKNLHLSSQVLFSSCQCDSKLKTPMSTVLFSGLASDCLTIYFLGRNIFQRRWQGRPSEQSW